MPRYNNNFSSGYRQRRRRRPRRRKPNPYSKTGMVKYAGYAWGAWKLAQKLKTLVNVEMKQHQSSAALSNVDHTTGAVNTLNTVSQGDTDATRDGDSIKCQKLKGKIYWKGNGANDSIGRFVIVHDKQNKISTIGDYFSNTADILTPLAIKNHDDRFQSKTLFDSGAFTLDTQEDTNRVFDINLPLGFHTQYDAGSTTINTGALKLIAVSSIATSNIPQLMFRLYLDYTDN